jgi:hypothetical protein
VSIDFSLGNARFDTINAGIYRRGKCRYTPGRRDPMRKLILPLTVFFLGLFIADYFFGVDVPGLSRGFGKFLADLFTVGNR